MESNILSKIIILCAMSLGSFSPWMLKALPRYGFGDAVALKHTVVQLWRGQITIHTFLELLWTMLGGLPAASASPGDFIVASAESSIVNTYLLCGIIRVRWKDAYGRSSEWPWCYLCRIMKSDPILSNRIMQVINGGTRGRRSGKYWRHRITIRQVHNYF